MEVACFKNLQHAQSQSILSLRVNHCGPSRTVKGVNFFHIVFTIQIWKVYFNPVRWLGDTHIIHQFVYLCMYTYIRNIYKDRNTHPHCTVSHTKKYPFNNKLWYFSSFIELRYHQEHQPKHHYHFWKIQNWDKIPIACLYERLWWAFYQQIVKRAQCH